MSTSVATKSTVASVAAVVTTLAFAVTASAASVTDLQSQVQALLAQISALQGGSSTMTTASSCSFTQNLELGSRGSQVLAVQQFLNSHGAQVASTGAGSPGNETTTFGPATKAAVKVFQSSNGVTPVSGYWGPLTRAAANAKCTTTTTTGSSTTTTTTVSGPISVALAASQPSGTVIAGQSSADLADLVFTGSGAVQTLVLQRTGISTDTTAKNIYLYSGNVRISDPASIVNGVVTFNSTNGLFNVSGSQTISVRADIDPSAVSGNTLGVNVSSFTALGASSSTAVSNVVGGVRMITTLSNPATLNFTMSGTQNPTINSSLQAGTTNYAVFSAPITVGTRALNLKALTFTYIGSADTSALANIGLYIDGVKQNATPMWSNTNGSNRVGFDMSASPVVLTTGSHTLELRADIVGGTSRSFTVSIQYPGDIIAEDSQVSGYYVGPTIAGSAMNFVNVSAGTQSVLQGNVTVMPDPNFSSVTNIVGGSTNTTIGSYQVQAYGEPVKIWSLSVLPVVNATTSTTGVAGTNGVSTGLRNVTIYANGAPIGTAVSTWTSGVLTYNLGSSLIIPAGATTTLQVRADIMDQGNNNYVSGTIRGDITGMQYQGTVSQMTATIGSTVNPYSSSNKTIQSTNVTYGSAAGFTSQTVSPNTTHVQIGSFALQTGSAEGAVVTNINVMLSGTAAAASGNIANLTVTGASNIIGQPVLNGGANNFSLTTTIPVNSSQVFNVYADIASTGGTIQASSTVQYRGATSNVSGTAGATGPSLAIAAGQLGSVKLDSSAPSSQYVVGGVTGVNVGPFNIVASSSNITLNQLTFGVTGTNGVSAVTVNGTKSTVVGSTLTMGGLSIAVPLGSAGMLVPVAIDLAPVTSQSNTSGTLVGLTLTGVQYQSGSNTTASTTAAASTQLVLVGTKPVVTVTSTVQSGLLMQADTQIGQVTVTADNAGPVSLRQMKFLVSASGFTGYPSNITAITLQAGGSGVNLNGANCTTTATTTTTYSISCPINGGYTIPGGQSVTFNLRGTLAGATNTGTNKAQVSTLVTNNPGDFQWIDLVGATSTPNVYDGVKIYAFPTTSFTVTQ